MTRLSTAAAVLVPALVSACPVCFDAADGNVLHFYSISTMMLSLLPFGILGGIALTAYHLRRQANLPSADLPHGAPARRA